MEPPGVRRQVRVGGRVDGQADVVAPGARRLLVLSPIDRELGRCRRRASGLRPVHDTDDVACPPPFREELRDYLAVIELADPQIPEGAP